jgi:hypothetical protein
MSRLLTYGILNQRRPAPPVPLLLDLYPTGVAGAFATFKMRAAYAGPCVRVRRSLDDAEQDIGFAAGTIDLDVAALLDFVEDGDGFVTIWYDQSGVFVNEVVNVATRQRQIVVGGALVMSGGKAAALTNDTRWGASTGNYQMQTTFTAFAVLSHDRSADGRFLGNAFNSLYGGINTAGGIRYRLDQSVGTGGGVVGVSERILFTSNGRATDGIVRKNGVTVGSNSVSFTAVNEQFNLTAGGGGSFPIKGIVQCLLWYHADQAANMAAIETYINAYYNVY